MQGLFKVDLNWDRKNAYLAAVTTANIASSAFRMRRIDMDTEQYADRILGEKLAWSFGMPKHVFILCV